MIVDESVKKQYFILGWDKAKNHLNMQFPERTDTNDALNAQQFAAYLIRTNYVKEVAKLIPLNWTIMEEKALTEMLKKKFSESQLESMFLKKSELRQVLKNRARNFGLISAVAIALIWCRDDFDTGAYLNMGLKFSTTVGGALILNWYFKGRDKSATTIMKRNMGRFGKWFQGCARTNKAINFLARRLAPALLIWDLRGLLMSGGLNGPNIPFDFIVEVDMFDHTTWTNPPRVGLNAGLDYYYFQKHSPQLKIGRQQLCLGVVRGSIVRGISRGLGF